jgi:hypothetical protein
MLDFLIIVGHLIKYRCIYLITILSIFNFVYVIFFVVIKFFHFPFKASLTLFVFTLIIPILP